MAIYRTPLALLPTLLGTAIAAVCYFPNGQSDSNPVNEQCISIEGHTSMCCAMNRTNSYGGPDSDGLTADRCISNGLCKNQLTTTNDDDEEVLVTAYWRDLCSSSEWPEGGCLNVCSNGDFAGSTAQITPCDGTDNSTEWCCGTDTDCCGTDSAVTIAPVLAALVTSSTSITSSTSSTVVPTSTGSAEDTSDAAVDSSSSSGLSTGAKAGIGVGVAVGAIAIIGALVLFWMRRRRSVESSYSPAPIPEAMSHPPTDEAASYGQVQHYVAEVDGGGIGELNAGEVIRHELPAGQITASQ